MEQILTTGDLILDQNAEQLKSIRRGEWTVDQIQNFFDTKEKQLEQVYLDSKLPYGPDEDAIKQLLMDCLESHYGSLEKCVVNPDKATQALMDIKKIIDRTV